MRHHYSLSGEDFGPKKREDETLGGRVVTELKNQGSYRVNFKRDAQPFLLGPWRVDYPIVERSIRSQSREEVKLA